MSTYSSDKCTKEKAQKFKKEVMKWLVDNNYDISKMKIKAFTCYNGDVRVYTGDKNTFTNSKKSVRKENGKYYKGLYSREYVEYVVFNSDEPPWEDDGFFVKEVLRPLNKFLTN